MTSRHQTVARFLHVNTPQSCCSRKNTGGRGDFILMILSDGKILCFKASTALCSFIFTHPAALKCFFSLSPFWPRCYLAHICLKRKRSTDYWPSRNISHCVRLLVRCSARAFREAVLRPEFIFGGGGGFLSAVASASSLPGETTFLSLHSHSSASSRPGETTFLSPAHGRLPLYMRMP